MKFNWPYLIGFLVIVTICAFYYVSTRPSWSPPPEPVSTIQPEKQQKPTQVEHPIGKIESTPSTVAEETTLHKPLPELGQSDTLMTGVLTKLFQKQDIDRFFIIEHFVERCVILVDSLTRSQLPKTHLPVKKTPGAFSVIESSGQLFTDSKNHLRYQPLIASFEALSQQDVIAVYARLYPLFQKAYNQLGYPDAYFNDRVVEVIDHLLATPEVNEPIELVRPKYYYQFADPQLEALSSGQKVLLRIGPENASRLKAILTGYRQALTAQNLP
ncbi:MAG: DUF3014 domain-containing protein [Deltaproteobacteria bacterium]|jgi:hypothetical protein|nr:DUF3014 domain-containing protein [Deltaproteobacteria bacterium]